MEIKTKRWLTAELFTVIIIFCIAGDGYSQLAKEKSPEADVVAVVNGKRMITQKELDDVLGFQLYSLQEKIYTLRKTALENLLIKVLIEEEANASGVSVEEFQNRLIPDNVAIKQSQIDQAFIENAAALTGMNEEEARQRIKLDLEVQNKMKRYRALIDELRSKAQITVALPPPIPPTMAVNAEGPSRGGDHAVITIIEFSDFQCPYCRQVTGILEQVLQAYKDDVRLVFKHMPLAIHPEAFKAAQAAVCADRQGKFWAYHDRLFHADQLTADLLKKYAREVGLRVNEFSTCLDSEASQAAVLKNILEATKANIHGTPSFFINGKPLSGFRGFEDFKKLIEQEIEVARTLKNPQNKPKGASK